MILSYNLFGPTRSQAHAWCVGRVKRHLETMCTSADKERGLVPYRITDAWGYDSRKRVLYLCEIKVQHKDFYKSVVQIMDTVRQVKLSPEYKRLDKGIVVPVIAISNGLYHEEIDYYPEEWKQYQYKWLIFFQISTVGSCLCQNTDHK